MRVHLVFIHVVCGVSVEVAGTEHVAAASFDVAGCHIKIGFGSFLLRGRSKVDKASGNRKERKQEQTRNASHLTLLKDCDLNGPTENKASLPSRRCHFKKPNPKLRDKNWAAAARKEFQQQRLGRE
jgi:hypothetical protein